MKIISRINKAILAVELSTIVCLQLLVVLMVVASTAVLYMLAWQTLRMQVRHIETVGDLLFVVQRSIAGILIVVLGLEVLETLKAYFRDHQVRLEVILVVAIIAAGRHLVQIDFEHVSALQAMGISAVVLSLTLGYYFVKKALADFPLRSEDSEK